MPQLITSEQANWFITAISGKDFSFRRLKIYIAQAEDKDRALEECQLAFTVPRKSHCFKWVRLKSNFQRYYQNDFARIHRFKAPDCKQYRFPVNDGTKFFKDFGKMVQDGVISTGSLHDTANKLIHCFELDYEKKSIVNNVHDYFKI